MASMITNIITGADPKTAPAAAAGDDYEKNLGSRYCALESLLLGARAILYQPAQDGDCMNCEAAYELLQTFLDGIKERDDEAGDEGEAEA